jgi:hypothetical protein
MINKHYGIIVTILSLLLLSAPMPLHAETTATQEYKIKAAFLYNFALYVEWPVDVFESGETPLIISVLGYNSFENALKTLQGKRFRNRSVIIKQISNIDQMENCHILFISRSEKIRLPEILRAAKKRPVLTVSDLDGFCKAGGMINFINLENKVRFDINLKAAQLGGLKIRTQLLRLAHDIE